MGVIGLALVVAGAIATPGTGPLVRQVAGAEVDFAAGTISARGGAAADYHLPTPDMARPGAGRRARAAALAKLKAALEALSYGPGHKPPAAEMDKMLVSARPAGADYQSNGGVFLTMRIEFDDQAAKPWVLAVTATPLEMFPAVIVGGHQLPRAPAVYRAGKPPPGAKATPAQRDDTGRLVVSPGKGDGHMPTGPVRLVIYVEAVNP